VLGGAITAPEGDRWKGDLLALGSAGFNAVFLVISRYLKGEILPSLMIGGVTGLLIALMFDVNIATIPDDLDWWLLWIQGFVVLGLSLVLFAVAPKYARQKSQYAETAAQLPSDQLLYYHAPKIL